MPAMAKRPKIISKTTNFFLRISGSINEDSKAEVERQVSAMVMLEYFILP
jgi:hypothetical protein